MYDRDEGAHSNHFKWRQCPPLYLPTFVRTQYKVPIYASDLDFGLPQTSFFLFPFENRLRPTLLRIILRSVGSAPKGQRLSSDPPRLYVRLASQGWLEGCGIAWMLEAAAAAAAAAKERLMGKGGGGGG